ncbi:Asp23/Gls24 family envelope stress response protein [Streptomyces sp. S.PB5]|uniref:Asp23/Gls24 family envelope stress response protein n=1 Tax=Streptomyces sp. S.PB5 TaxID=3020844 RepID=UPI0025B172A6|nr:Asp23/Gls24 family envelope stress response protein [Streptomyces sp. S.PB5]MDN3026023.1 Asp23/Gls24 family envelope stress response protein [Streptomyces sp. S.PB5]
MAMNADPNSGTPDGAGGEGVPGDDRLPCGRELADVWRQWEEGPVDPHTRACPHCSAALHELDALEDVVRQARADEPAQDDGGALVERVMDVVRLELRPGRTLPLGTPAEDDWIVEAAAAKVFRAAADSLPGVRASSCRVAPQDPAVTGSRARGPVTVRIEVAVAMTVNLRQVAEQVRERVLAAADDQLGMAVGSVDVTVTDVLDDEDPAKGGPR